MVVVTGWSSSSESSSDGKCISSTDGRLPLAAKLAIRARVGESALADRLRRSVDRRLGEVLEERSAEVGVSRPVAGIEGVIARGRERV